MIYSNLIFFQTLQFARLEDARNAVNLNGQLEIAGRAIKVLAELNFENFNDINPEGHREL